MGCENSKKNSGNSPLKISTQSVAKCSVKDIEAKVVLLGDSGVGKSSIATRFSKNTFNENYEVTIGGAYFQNQITTECGIIVKLHIWDTGGAERFRSMAHIYYQDAVAAVMTYDITKFRTLDGIKYWMNDLSLYENPKEMVLALAANKCDKQPEDELTIPLGKKYADENGMIFKTTSALSGEGIQDLFKKIAEALAMRKST